MKNIKTALALELPHIETALAFAVENLPVSAQPIARHILGAGGKRLRPFLALLFARIFSSEEKNFHRLAITLELLHAATLLHDDVLDKALNRRGQASAHTVFDVASVILGGDVLLSHANSIVASYGDIRLTHCFSEAITRTAAGEIMEIAAKGRVDVSAHEYEDIIRGKTAWLIRASCEMGALAAGANAEHINAAARYGENLGMAFQMVDDALDFAPQEVTGKPVAGDVREGKFTLPMRLYRQSLPDGKQTAFDTAFANGYVKEDDITAIASSIRSAGFDTQARHEAQKYLQAALAALDDLPDVFERSLLREMCAYVYNREK